MYEHELSNRKEELNNAEYLQLNKKEKYQKICEIMEESAFKATYGEKWESKVMTVNGKIKKKQKTHKNISNTSNPA